MKQTKDNEKPNEANDLVIEVSRNDLAIDRSQLKGGDTNDTGTDSSDN